VIPTGCKSVIHCFFTNDAWIWDTVYGIDFFWIPVRQQIFHPLLLSLLLELVTGIHTHGFLPDTGKTTNFLPPPLLLLLIGSGIRDPRSGIRDPRTGIRDKQSGHPPHSVESHSHHLGRVPLCYKIVHDRSRDEKKQQDLKFKHERRIKNIGITSVPVPVHNEYGIFLNLRMQIRKNWLILSRNFFNKHC
jgi:hypothetical protein